MSEEFPGAWIFDYTFPVVDAAITEWAADTLSGAALRADREPVSAGSVRYLLHRREQARPILGEIKARMMNDHQTLVTIAPLYIDIVDFDAWMRYFTYLLATFISWIEIDQSRVTFIIEAGKQIASTPPARRPATLPTRQQGGARSNPHNTWARAQIAAGEDRQIVYFEWLKRRGLDPSSDDVQRKWRDAFRKAIDSVRT